MLALLVSFLLSACASGQLKDDDDESDADTDTDSDSDTDSDTDTDTEPPCVAVRFARDPVAWPLPDFCDENNDDGYPACRLTTDNYVDRSGNTTYYSTFDLDGDGRLDLVRTRDSEESNDVGRTRWELHAGGDGFGEATAWSLPDFCDENNDDGYPACRFPADNYVDRSGNTTYYSTFDLDGDGRLDLVRTRDSEGGNDIGRTRWELHAGGDGFGEATAWSLPDFCDENNDDGYPACRLAADNYVDRSGNTTYFSTFDLDGDGRLDLVRTRDSEGGNDVGRTRWELHAGGDGFGEVSAWSLPDFCDENNDDGYPACRLPADNYVDRSGNTTYYSTLDLDGDGQLDLVRTRDSGGGNDVGRTRWELHAGGDGFGEVTAWSLPDFCDENNDDGYPACRLTADNYVDRSGNTTYYSTFDLNGDGQVDLVRTRDSEGGNDVGRTRWELHAGGDGFGEATAWSLPDFCDENNDDGYPACRLTADNYVDRSGNTTYYSTFDLTGDGLLDMVVTRDSELGDDIGRTGWMVYPGECE